MAKYKDNRTWFQKVSRGGQRYIDLSNPYNLSHLSDKELYYLEKQQKWFHYDISANTRAAYLDLDKEMRANRRSRQQAMLSGELYREGLEMYKENYVEAINFTGNGRLSYIFEAVWDSLSESEKTVFTEDDIPEIPLFYKTKLVAETGKKHNQVAGKIVSSHIKQLEEVLKDYVVEKNIKLNMNPKDFKSDKDMKFYNDFIKNARKEHKEKNK